MAHLNKDGIEHLAEKIKESHWGGGGTSLKFVMLWKRAGSLKKNSTSSPGRTIKSKLIRR